MGPLLFRHTVSLPPPGLGTLGLVEHACPLRLGVPGHRPVPPVAAPSLQSWLWPDRLRQQSSLGDDVVNTASLWGEGMRVSLPLVFASWPEGFGRQHFGNCFYYVS